MSADRLIKLLSTAFRKDPGSNNYKIIAIIATGFDELEKVLEDIKNAHFVETAQGKSLDYIAKLFNVTRQQGESDEDLRARLFVEFKKYLSCGTKDDILQVVKFYAKLRDEDYRNIPFMPDNLFILEPEPAHFVVVIPVLNTYDEELRCKLYSEEFRAWFKEKLQYIVDQVKVGGVKGDVIIFYPKSSGFDNQGFVGILAFVFVGETSCYDSMGLVSSEAQALAGESNSYDNQGVNSSRAKVIILEDNNAVTCSSAEYQEYKRLSYSGSARFTKITVHVYPVFGGAGWVKIEYSINDGDWELITEEQVTVEATITKDINIEISEVDKIDFRLLMKADVEQIGNDTFKVEGVYP